MIKPIRPKILVPIALGSVIVLGLLYWRFPASFPFGDQRPKTEIFAEAFGRGNFNRCYQLMSDDYKSEIPRSMFVEFWGSAYPSLAQHHGSFQNIGEPINARHRFSSDALFPSPQRKPTRSYQFLDSIRYTIEYSNGNFNIYLITTDMKVDSPIQRFGLGGGRMYSPFAPPPMPAAPLS